MSLDSLMDSTVITGTRHLPAGAPPHGGQFGGVTIPRPVVQLDSPPPQPGVRASGTEDGGGGERRGRGNDRRGVSRSAFCGQVLLRDVTALIWTDCSWLVGRFCDRPGDRTRRGQDARGRHGTGWDGL